MSDLYIDNEMLQDVRKNLATIETRLRKPIKEMDRINARAMGVAELERAMETFGEEWGYGIGQLKKVSKSAVKALDKIQDKFNGLDQELAEQLSKNAKGKK